MHWKLTGTIIDLVIFPVGYRFGRSCCRVVSKQIASTPGLDITEEQVEPEPRAGRKIEAITNSTIGATVVAFKEARHTVEAMGAGVHRARVIQ